MQLEFKPRREGLFEQFAPVLAEQARQQERSQLHAFITGAGRTGKSNLLKMVHDRIKLVLHSKQHKRTLVLAAPTGVAARNIIGTTINRAFKLPVDQSNVGRFRKLESEALNLSRKI